jgi:UDP-N-acetylmuramoyl-L-alanyl-D-glutamate--2,6-diaminopimelate ligase
MALLRLDSIPAASDWLRARGARALATDSRQVRAGDAFLAWPGRTHDARRHAPAALAGGALAALLEADGVEAFAPAQDPRCAAFPGLKAAAGVIASRFLDEPSAALRVVACTGTNGKTSTAWWVAQALTHLGTRCGVIGTLGRGEPPRQGGAEAAALADEGLTTPDAVTLQTTLRGFVDAGFGAAAMEASSIGIAEHRLEGTHVEVAVFTNFTQDHLDYHGDMAAYWEAKARLFRWPGLKAAIVNVDDLRGLELCESLADSPLDVWTCSTQHAARLRAHGARHDARGLAFEVREGEQRAAVSTQLLGAYNVCNVLGVVGVLRACGHALADAAAACAMLTPVPGRMQRVGDGVAAPQVVVDYAHTPDALDKALAALRPLAAERGGRLWCVFGCGGDRDPGKRPLMGAIACRLADCVVVTSDNPRLEPPDFIISQILAGIVGHDEVHVIENRAEALRHAIRDADPRDVVLLAGKGHENYQDAGGVRHPFSDVAEAEAALRARSGA